MRLLARALLCCAVMAAGAVAAVDVNGTINLDTQWSDTVNLTGVVTVADGVTLSIVPGTVVIAQGRFSLNVQGRLQAVGTESDSIRFGAASTDGWYGIRFDGSPSTNDSSLISHAVIRGGVSDGSGSAGTGGGLFVDGFAKLRVGYCTIRENTARYGGGMYIAGGADIVVHDCSIVNNNAPSTGSAGIGAGAYVSNASPTLTGNTFSGNVAITAGGICLRSSSSVVSNNTIRNNECQGIMSQAYDGAGVYIQQSSVRLLDNVISGNSAQRDGGGVFITNASGSVVARNKICGNSGLDGGGVYCGSGSPLFSCNLVANNASVGKGAGMYLTASSADILNATIVNNVGDEGGGIACESTSSPALRNCILWGNSGFWGGDQGYAGGGSAPSLSCCAVQDGQTGFATSGGWDSIITDAPLFTAPSGGTGASFDGLNADWSLQDGSPCINRGSSDTSDIGVLDLAGATRMQDGRIDMGALEHELTSVRAAQAPVRLMSADRLSCGQLYDLRGRLQRGSQATGIQINPFGMPEMRSLR